LGDLSDLHYLDDLDDQNYAPGVLICRSYALGDLDVLGDLSDLHYLGDLDDQNYAPGVLICRNYVLDDLIYCYLVRLMAQVLSRRDGKNCFLF
ncbi:MAG: hypothetical protein RR217_06635, partial [Mucinivorans sp.]